jgi:hypothetical protein
MQRERFERGARVRTIAGGVVAVTVAIWAGGCVGVGSSPAPATPPGTTGVTGAPPSAAATTREVLVVSSVMPFQLVLPPGWEGFGAGTDEQSFGTSDAKLTLIVGRAQIEPGQTVTDRVAHNRATEFRDCASEPSRDRPINIDTEPGILWSVHCGDRMSLAANTIHEGRGYRLLLQSSSPDAMVGLEPLLRAFVESFRFTD